LSNLLPKETAQMCRYALDGNFKAATELQLKYIPLIKSLFCEVNPIPVKAAMAHLGYTENLLRSPLYPMEEANEEKLLRAMKNAGMKL
jgi:4-hydroxy-tetrahydrodipicolinate synthase